MYLFKLSSLCFVALVSSLLVFGQEKPGDVTRDGILDGRDALKIMRAVEGFEPLTETIQGAGDVFPYPGTDGRTWGDGIVNRDDALRILRMQVGLVPEGELTGDFSQSAPAIDEFNPLNGPVGTQVAITGSNFSALATANAVWFGDLPALVLQASNTQITVQVPQGAKTSLIRIQTPGGTALSKGEFVVTVLQKGNLILPPGLNHSDFIISSGYADTENIDQDGGFSIPVADQKVNLIAAVPKGEGNHTFMALWLPDDAENQPRRVDSASTARALTYLCPFFTTDDTSAARMLLSTMESLPEIQALEQTIVQRYPQKVEGLDDPAVGAAWDSAVTAVIEALPESLVVDFNENSSTLKKTGSRISSLVNPMSSFFGVPVPNRLVPLAASKENTTLMGVDRNYLGAEVNDAGRLSPSLEKYSPTDWLAVLYQLDTNDLPRGVNEPLRDLLQRGPKTLDGTQSTLLGACQWTANVDVVYTLVDKVLQKMSDSVWPGDNSFELKNEEGVYVLHGFSGVTFTGTEQNHQDFENLKNFPNGLDNHIMACAVNLAIAAIDSWEFFDQNAAANVQGSVLKAGIKNVMRKLSQIYGGMNIETMTAKDWFRALWECYFEFRKAAATTLLTEYPKTITQSMSKTISSAGNKANVLLAVLGRVALVGKVSERIAGLAGYTFTLNPYYPITAFTSSELNFFEIYQGPRTLESIFVVVGDPFSPKISSIEPAWGGKKSVVTIKGSGFAKKAEDNTVTFKGIASKSGKVLEVDNYGMTLKVEVPVLSKDNSYNIILSTPPALKEVAAPSSFLYRKIPVITSISPRYGFAALPADAYSPLYGNGRNGSEMILAVEEWADEKPAHELYIDQQKVDYSVKGVLEKQVVFLIPEMKPGKHTAYFRCPKLDNLQTAGIEFTVLEAPEILKIEPEEIRSGQLVQIIGFNFGDWPSFTAVQIGDRTIEPALVEPNRITFNMPFFEQSGASMPLKVLTPSGESNEMAITYYAGGADYNPSPLPAGWSIVVTEASSGKEADGKITLDEAAAFARGEINPFTPPWDDENIEEEIQYHEVKNADGSSSWEEGTKTTKRTSGGPGEEYHRIYGTYHHLDGSVTTNENQTSLDADGILEEGDRIQGTSAEKGGKDYRDSIKIDSSLTGDIFAVDLQLGRGDSLNMKGKDRTLRLGGRGLTLIGDCNVEIPTMDTPLDVAVILEGNSGNSITIDRLINAPSTAVYLKNSWFNTIDVTVENGLGNGVVIEGGGQNTLEGTIENGKGHGVLMTNSVYNTLNYITIAGCSKNGLYISGGQSNRVFGGSIHENGGTGILLDGSQKNQIDQLQSYSNEFGLRITGSASKENRIIWCGFGSSENRPKTGNRRHGVWIDQSASQNVILSCDVGENQEYGVLVEGSNTIQNEIGGSDVSNTVYSWGNGKDGIALLGGTSSNRIIRLYSYSNGGNGALVSGENTDSNTFELCQFGDASYDYTINEHLYYPNAEWGLAIRDKAQDTLVEQCNFASNTLGNLLAENLTESKSEEDWILKILDCSFGCRVFANADTFWSLRDVDVLDKTTKNGIELKNVRRVWIQSTYFHSLDTHIVLNKATDCFLYDVYGEKARNYALHILSGENITLQSIRDTGTMGGLYAQDTQQCTIESVGFSATQGSSILLDTCKNVTLSKSDISFSHQGTRVTNSTDIQFTDCNVIQNKSDGVIVDGASSRVTFVRTHSQQNEGAGYLLENCSHVTLYGTQPREGLFVSENKKTAIIVRNAQNIHLGYQGKGLNVFGYPDQGILIDGEHTENVQIASSMIYYRLGGIGIRVSNGKNILIGGQEADDRNNIEFSQNPGILVEKDASQVAILNNLIGEPENWETGTQSNGNLVAIQLAGAKGTVIQGNLINNNKKGIEVLAGSSGNQIIENQITENSGTGVQIDGSESIENVITRNYFRATGQRVIALTESGNKAIQAPEVNRIGWEKNNISGVCEAPDGSQIEVYAFRSEDNQYRIIGTARLYQGKFSASGQVEEGEAVSALVIDPDGNTSEMGNVYYSDSFSGGQPPIVYTSELNGNQEIFLKPSGTEASVRLTDLSSADYSPQFSKDGSKILFVSDRAGNDDLWIMNQDGSSAASITNHSAPDYDPAWMDANRIVYVSERDGNPEIYADSTDLGNEIYYYTGESPYDVMQSKGSGFATCMSVPGGGKLEKIAFCLSSDTQYYPAAFTWKITTVENGPTNTVLAEGSETAAAGGWLDIDTKNLLVPSEFAICYYFTEAFKPPLMSTLGGEAGRNWIYNSSTQKWTSTTFYYFMIKAVMGGGGTGPVRLTNNPGADRHPAVSPDGKQIAFTSERNGKTDVWIMNVDGSNPVRLTDGQGKNANPVWSPDGSRVAFVSDRDGNNEIYTIDVVTHELSRMTNHAGDDIDPAWQRTSDKILFSSNRDGAYQIYSLAAGNTAPKRITYDPGDSVQPDSGVKHLSAKTLASTEQRAGGDNQSLVSPTGEIAPLSLPVLSVSSASGESGDTLSCDVRLTGAQRIGNLAFHVGYDGTAMQLQDVTYDNFAAEPLLAINPDLYPSNREPIRASWVDAGGVDGDLKIISLAMKTSASADSGEYSIVIQNVSAYDVELNPVSIDLQPGVISLIGNQTPVRSWMLY